VKALDVSRHSQNVIPDMEDCNRLLLFVLQDHRPGAGGSGPRGRLTAYRDSTAGGAVGLPRSPSLGIKRIVTAKRGSLC